MLKRYSEEDRFYEVIVKGINTIITEVDAINEMLNEFSQFTRFPETKIGKYDIVPIIEDVIGLLKDSYRNMVFTFIHAEKSIFLKIDGMQIRRALLNILQNSIAAVNERGTVTVECYRGDSSGAVRRHISAVTDNGSGIDPDIKDSIFDPYVSKNGRGSGLGLTIVEKIVFDNNGRIWFDSEPGKTTFYLEFEEV
jgi:two-component system nitrogen regulation sensor histidine kinase NtrY